VHVACRVLNGIPGRSHARASCGMPHAA
jgi:hypothetical protein